MSGQLIVILAVALLFDVEPAGSFVAATVAVFETSPHDAEVVGDVR